MLCLLATALASLPEHRRVAMMRVHSDVMAVLQTPECRDASMPSTLEKRSSSVQTMMTLWDRSVWEAHRSGGRWRHFILDWPKSSILAAIRGPLLSLIAMSVALAVFNRWSSRLPRLTLPLAPLSLQATSIGLMLVFRTNQAHERFKEAQCTVGGLQSIVRELVELMLLHSGQGAPMPAPIRPPPLPPDTAEARAAAGEAARTEQRIASELSLAARLLAMFGWALKARLHPLPS